MCIRDRLYSVHRTRNDGSRFYVAPCSHVAIKQPCKYTTSVDIKKRAVKGYLLMQIKMWAQWFCSRKRTHKRSNQKRITIHQHYREKFQFVHSSEPQVHPFPRPPSTDQADDDNMRFNVLWGRADMLGTKYNTPWPASSFFICPGVLWVIASGFRAWLMHSGSYSF